MKDTNFPRQFTELEFVDARMTKLDRFLLKSFVLPLGLIFFGVLSGIIGAALPRGYEGASNIWFVVSTWMLILFCVVLVPFIYGRWILSRRMKGYLLDYQKFIRGEIYFNGDPI